MPALHRARSTIALLVAALLALTAAFSATAANATPVLVEGTLVITSGNDSRGLTGSYFQIRDPDGDVIPNPATDLLYTLLNAGTDGLTLLSLYEPDPAFDTDGNALADEIILPTLFQDKDFSVATPGTDPDTDAPQIIVDLLADPPTITVDFDSWTAYWNHGIFNQGASFQATSFDLDDGRIVLDWSKLITSGPFTGFTGNWHIEGIIT